MLLSTDNGKVPAVAAAKARTFRSITTIKEEEEELA